MWRVGRGGAPSGAGLTIRTCWGAQELKKLLAEVHAALPEGVTEPDEVVRALGAWGGPGKRIEVRCVVSGAVGRGGEGTGCPGAGA
jgi:hypothetical protein